MPGKKDRGIPYEAAPTVQPYFGQPESCFDLINQYGTYNVQRTNESENLFPLIAQGLPRRWRGMAIGRDELEDTAQ